MEKRTNGTRALNDLMYQIDVSDSANWTINFSDHPWYYYSPWHEIRIMNEWLSSHSSTYDLLEIAPSLCKYCSTIKNRYCTPPPYQKLWKTKHPDRLEHPTKTRKKTRKSRQTILNDHCLYFEQRPFWKRNMCYNSGEKHLLWSMAPWITFFSDKQSCLRRNKNLKLNIRLAAVQPDR